MDPKTLQEIADSKTREGTLYEKLPGRKTRCFACGHRCLIPEGRRGICKVRFNAGGALRVPYGYVAALHCDPVEKKPFFHVLPGARALTFGMLGCDFHCAYCQNWDISQTFRDENAGTEPADATPGAVCDAAERAGAALVVSSYNEPLITAEWAVKIFMEARARGLKTAFVSNGNATPEVLEYIRPHTDAYKVDLKSMKPENYRALGGQLSVVLDSIQLLVQMGFWLEIVSLLIPGFNDSDEELKAMAGFLAGISADIPWHVTAFHKDYRMTDPDNTPVETLVRAARIGRDAGLKFVYAGNLPGRTGNWENTSCPSCGRALIERRGFRVLTDRVGKAGKCPDCRAAIPGIWS